MKVKFKVFSYFDFNSRVGSLYCSGLQNFDFVPETYDVIWCQVTKPKFRITVKGLGSEC